MAHDRFQNFFHARAGLCGRLHDLFVEPRIVRLQRLHKDQSRRRLNLSMKFDADIDIRTDLRAQRLEVFDCSIDVLLPFHILVRAAAKGS